MAKTDVTDEILGASGLTLPDDVVGFAKDAVSSLITRATTQENGAGRVDRRFLYSSIAGLY